MTAEEPTAPPFDPEEVHDAARSELDDAVELRREIHRRPELGLELPVTQQAVLDRLADLPLEITTGRSTTSVVADLRAGAGPTLVLRADMDALPMPEDTDLPYRSEVPGAMHACGHDAHTAMLVAAARVLCRWRDRLAGTVRFMFQPGEEGHHGARHMIDEGVLEGADAAFAIHITPNVPSGVLASRPGPFMASADELTITVTGRGGHASTPHYAADPIPVAAEIVTAIQSMITRRVDVAAPAVCTIAQITAGTTTNVIPERAVMRGTLRTLSTATREQVLADLDRLVSGIATAHGMTATLEVTRGYPVTVNHGSFVDRVGRVCRHLWGGRGFVLMPSPVMGAEDFSYVLERTEGAMALLGACPPGADPRRAPPNHSNRMTLDEEAMAAGIATHVAVALDTVGAAGSGG